MTLYLTEEGASMEKFCGQGDDLCAYEKEDRGEKTPTGCVETSGTTYTVSRLV